MALGALAAIALAVTTYASFKALKVATRAAHRFERQEARKTAQQFKALTQLLQAAGKTAAPQLPRHPNHEHQHCAAPVVASQVAAPPPAPVVITAYGLDAIGPSTHDPIELRRRADRLGQLGLGVPVLQTHVNGSTLTAVLANDPHALVLLPEKIGDATVGVRLREVTPPLLATGLRSGDVLTTLNGLRLKNAADLAVAFAASKQATPHVAVVELLRAGRPTILEVFFTD